MKTENKLKLNGIFRDFHSIDNLIFVCELLIGEIIIGKHLLLEDQAIGEIVSFDTIKLPFSNNTYEITIYVKGYKWSRNDIIDKVLTSSYCR